MGEREMMIKTRDRKRFLLSITDNKLNKMEIALEKVWNYVGGI